VPIGVPAGGIGQMHILCNCYVFSFTFARNICWSMC
jgi:hypothetical protein